MSNPNLIYLQDSGNVVYVLGITTMFGQPELTQTVMGGASPSSPVYLVDQSTLQNYLLGISTQGQLTLTISANEPSQVSQLLILGTDENLYSVQIENTQFSIQLAGVQPVIINGMVAEVYLGRAIPDTFSHRSKLTINPTQIINTPPVTGNIVVPQSPTNTSNPNPGAFDGTYQGVVLSATQSYWLHAAGLI
jgi:hypothetical protein